MEFSKNFLSITEDFIKILNHREISKNELWNICKKHNERKSFADRVIGYLTYKIPIYEYEQRSKRVIYGVLGTDYAIKLSKRYSDLQVGCE